MIEPIPKPSKKPKRNRKSYEYTHAKAQFLEARRNHQGYWMCNLCSRLTDSPELDHIMRVGMGGAPSRLMDARNWQILCHDCHQAKDGGMEVK